MRKWTTDGSAEADSRISRLERWLIKSSAPMWLLNAIRWVFFRAKNAIFWVSRKCNRNRNPKAID